MNTTTHTLNDTRPVAAADEPTAAVQACAEDRVLLLTEGAFIANLSIITFRRLIDAGDGPTITRLSTRRLGVRVKHLRQWLDARAVAPKAA